VKWGSLCVSHAKLVFEVVAHAKLGEGIYVIELIIVRNVRRLEDGETAQCVGDNVQFIGDMPNIKSILGQVLRKGMKGGIRECGELKLGVCTALVGIGVELGDWSVAW
jgi:hypothetical protein